MHPSERELGSHVVVDLEVELDLRLAGASDRPEDTLSYSVVEGAVRRRVEDGEYKLLEALAEHVAEDVLALPRARAVVVRITKPPRLPAQTVGFAVELRRP